LRWKSISKIAATVLLISGSSTAQETAQYSYDALGRLTVATYTGGPRAGKQNGLAYDPAGNRTAQAYGLALPGANNAVSFSVSVPATVHEGQSALFTITKSAPSRDPLTVNYSTNSGTAVSPGDFTAASGTVTFLGWETVKTIAVPAIDDGIAEGAENFSMALSSPSSPATLGVSSAAVTVSANGPNQPPVTQPDSVFVPSCSPGQVVPTANDTDPEGNYPLYLVSVSNSSLVDYYWDIGAPNPTLFLTATGSGGTGTLTYQVRDSRGAISTGMISFTANPYNPNCFQ
jgi:YD repeat-containing protein